MMKRKQGVLRGARYNIYRKSGAFGGFRGSSWSVLTVRSAVNVHNEVELVLIWER